MKTELRESRKWMPYPAYKDSGVEWLVKIPKHWESKRVKYLARFQYGDSLPDDARADGDIQVFGSNGPVGTHSKANTLAPALVIGRKGSYGKINYSEQSCFAIDTTYFVDSRSSKANLRWLWYGLSALGLDAFSEDSAVPGLSREHAYSKWLPEPPAEEQRDIVSFLDRETEKIDALVAKKERLIELLQEKRAALISRTITRGLPPTTTARLPENPTFKPSGIPGLGEIPRDWTVARLRRACINIFLGLTSTVDYVDDGGFPLVRALNIAGGKLDFAEARFISEEQHRQLTKYRRAKQNDVLLSKSGSIGTAALVETNREFSIYESIFALRAAPSLLLPKYLLHVLRSDICQSQYLASLVGMGVGHLNMSDITEILVTLPPLPEQVAIAAYLNDETAKLDTLAAKVKEAIERLQEYRTALISAAVTGKIDLRDNNGSGVAHTK